ncbi:MAG: vWA domain-containing protein [Streptosporangiaceae bacterium]
MTTNDRVATGAAAARATADHNPADRTRHPAVPDVVATMTGFARALRMAGVSADRTRLTTSIAALAEIDPLDIDEVYWATRLSLCSEPDDLPPFDAVFGQWFRGSAPALPGLALLPPAAGMAQVRPLAAETDGEGESDDVLATASSDLEILRRHDIAELSEHEREEVYRMIALLAPRVATRRSLRWAPGGRKHIDVRRTVRQLLHDGGEPGALRYDHRRAKPRRLVLLLDVSGSMAPYADVLLRFAHAAVRVAPATTEVFTVSTRLTRITRQLRIRDPDLALRAAGATVPDWSGGTLLGETLRAFLDRWGQRGTARRAVVIIASDGWERGDAALLGEQAARLARLAHALIWVNPHRGKSGFAPETAGMVAVLPHIDELVAGHSFDALRRVADVIRST